jgi:hypothetical protein
MVKLFTPQASARQTASALPATNTDKRLPSVQEQYVALRAVRQDVMCVASGPTRTARSKRRRTRRRQTTQVELSSVEALPAEATGELYLYRAALALSSVNFTLKSSAEQEALLAGYHSFLNGLDFPTQTLVRVLPLDLEPYLQPYRERFALAQPHGVSTEAPGPAALADLAADHVRFVRLLAQRHTFLERRFYLVIPVESDADSSSDMTGISGGAKPAKRSIRTLIWNSLSPRRRREQRAAEAQARFAAITQCLDLRVATLIRELARFGVEARRLSGRELVDLYYSCLSPAEAAAMPLPTEASRTALSATNCTSMVSGVTIGSASQVSRQEEVPK